MFSGLVPTLGEVHSLRRRAAGASLEVRCVLPGEPLQAGESIAVQGVCLTAVTVNAQGFAADLSRETLSRTTLGTFRAGVKVNLERSLRLDSRIGGHLVMGHVDATCRVVAIRAHDAFETVRFVLPAGLAPQVAEKGSIAVDGVSLTVASVGERWFEVALVPATLSGTTLGQLRPGDKVNLETDILAKYIQRAMSAKPTSIASLLAGLPDATD